MRMLIESEVVFISTIKREIIFVHLLNTVIVLKLTLLDFYTVYTNITNLRFIYLFLLSKEYFFFRIFAFNASRKRYITTYGGIFLSFTQYKLT